MRSHWQKYLVYVSLAFVAYYIYTHRLSQWFEVKSYVYLSLSVVSLLLGFVFDAISWKKILEPFATTISYTEAFASTGINIFAKYIPGKVLMIVGRAAFVSKKQGEISKLSGISLYAQLLSIIAGFVIGSFALFQSTISVKLKTALCLFMVLVFIWILSEKVKQQSIYILNKFLGKSLKIIHLSAYNTIKQLPWFAAIWFFWSLGFALLGMAFFDIDKVFIMVGSAYALAAITGIVLLIAPGGLGVREGILVLLLTYYGLNLEQAIFFAGFSRLWYFFGEAFSFITGYICSKIEP